MSEVERVNAAWDRIEYWYQQNWADLQLPAGAAAAEIQELEDAIHLTLPEGLKASLLRHNGVGGFQWPKICLFSTKQIHKFWKDFGDLLDAGEYDNATLENNPKLQQGFWNKSWIPFEGDGNLRGCCLDLQPGPEGIVGQVLDIDHGGPNGPNFNDYAGYLEDIADILESGQCFVEDGQLMGLY